MKKEIPDSKAGRHTTLKQDFGKIAVVGAGTMGTGIAQIAATHGHETVLIDNSADQLDKSDQSLRKILRRQVEKSRMTQDEVEGILSRLSFVSDIAHAEGSSLTIEAVVEDLDVKRALFREIESCVGQHAVLATNTSSLSVTSISTACKNPHRFLGMHFFNPAPLMALTEIIPAIDTDRDVTRRVIDLTRGWGKSPVLAKDTPGFIVNRVARSFYSESLRLVDEGIATCAQVDDALKSVGGFRMGPFELMDLIGNDVNLKVTESVFQAFHYDPRYRPSFTQTRLVEAGRLGRKSGRGYYDYESDRTHRGTDIDSDLAKIIVNRVVSMIMNEAIDAVFWGVASPEDIDTAMTKGVNYPKGPIQWAEEVGLDEVLKTINELRLRYSEDRYRPSPLLKELVASGGSLYG